MTSIKKNDMDRSRIPHNNSTTMLSQDAQFLRKQETIVAKTKKWQSVPYGSIYGASQNRVPYEQIKALLAGFGDVEKEPASQVQENPKPIKKVHEASQVQENPQPNEKVPTEVGKPQTIQYYEKPELITQLEDALQKILQRLQKLKVSGKHYQDLFDMNHILNQLLSKTENLFGKKDDVNLKMKLVISQSENSKQDSPKKSKNFQAKKVDNAVQTDITKNVQQQKDGNKDEKKQYPINNNINYNNNNCINNSIVSKQDSFYSINNSIINNSIASKQDSFYSVEENNHSVKYYEQILVDHSNNKKCLDEIVDLKSSVNRLFLDNKQISQNIKEGDDKQSFLIEELNNIVNQLYLENQQLKQTIKKGNEKQNKQISELQTSFDNWQKQTAEISLQNNKQKQFEQEVNNSSKSSVTAKEISISTKSIQTEQDINFSNKSSVTAKEINISTKSIQTEQEVNLSNKSKLSELETKISSNLTVLQENQNSSINFSSNNLLDSSNNLTEQNENSSNNLLLNQPRGFQNFEIPQNQKVVNLRQFRKLLSEGKILNITLNLTENDFEEDGVIVFEVNKQQVIKGLTINCNCFKNNNNLIRFIANQSITFENCDFNQVVVRILCNRDDDNFKIAYLQIYLLNIICRNSGFDFGGCLEIFHARKIYATNLCVENENGRDGLYLYNCSKVELQQASAYNCLRYGIQIENCYDVSIMHTIFSNCGNVGCLWSHSGGRILNSGVQNCQTGIYLILSKVFMDERCEFHRNDKDFDQNEESQWLTK